MTVDLNEGPIVERDIVRIIRVHIHPCEFPSGGKTAVLTASPGFCASEHSRSVGSKERG